MDPNDFFTINKPETREYNSSCIFCEGKFITNGKSSEHVIPKWVQKYLDISNHLIELVRYNPLTNEYTKVRNSHTLDQFREGRVCKLCNSGWMAKLESEISPVLIPLMNSQINFYDLTQNQLLALSKWSFKTALMINSASNFFKVIPHEHYKLFYDNLFPKHLIITASFHKPTLRFKHQESTLWTGSNSSITEEMLREGAIDGYKTVLQFRNLILLIAYWPLEGWKYKLVKDLHHVVLKPENNEVYYNATNMQDFSSLDSVGAAINVAGGLEVFI